MFGQADKPTTARAGTRCNVQVEHNVTCVVVGFVADMPAVEKQGITGLEKAQEEFQLYYIILCYLLLYYIFLYHISYIIYYILYIIYYILYIICYMLYVICYILLL